VQAHSGRGIYFDDIEYHLFELIERPNRQRLTPACTQ
jgi:hypothetical protein